MIIQRFHAFQRNVLSAMGRFGEKFGAPDTFYGGRALKILATLAGEHPIARRTHLQDSFCALVCRTAACRKNHHHHHHHHLGVCCE
jgi:hypothetical protein